MEEGVAGRSDVDAERIEGDCSPDWLSVNRVPHPLQRPVRPRFDSGTIDDLPHFGFGHWIVTMTRIPSIDEAVRGIERRPPRFSPLDYRPRHIELQAIVE